MKYQLVERIRELIKDHLNRIQARRNIDEVWKLDLDSLEKELRIEQFLSHLRMQK